MSAAIIQHHREAELKLRRIRKALGWEPGDPPFDEALAIDMLESMGSPDFHVDSFIARYSLKTD